MDRIILNCKFKSLEICNFGDFIKITERGWGYSRFASMRRVEMVWFFFFLKEACEGKIRPPWLSRYTKQNSQSTLQYCINNQGIYIKFTVYRENKRPFFIAFPKEGMVWEEIVRKLGKWEESGERDTIKSRNVGISPMENHFFKPEIRPEKGKQSKKTYVEALQTRRVFRVTGSCDLEIEKGEFLFVPESEAMRDRKSFLETAIILIIEGFAEEVSELRKWIVSGLKIKGDFDINRLWPENFLLLFSSINELERVAKLSPGSWKNYEIQVLWLKQEYGQRNFRWIRINNLPFFFWSGELFKLVGDFCGGFVQADLSRIKCFMEVMILTKCVGEVPNFIWIKDGKNRWKIFISEEKTPVCTGVSELPASNFGRDYGSKDSFWKTSELSEKIIVAGKGCRHNNCQVGGGSVETFTLCYRVFKGKGRRGNH